MGVVVASGAGPAAEVGGQYGHQGDDVPDRVARLWSNLPVKAVMNAEPTDEETVRPAMAPVGGRATRPGATCARADDGGRVRGRELWQWRIHADEPGFHPYFLADGAGWREALAFEGSRYVVGLVGKILAGLPTSNLEPSWDLCLTTRGLVDPGVLWIGYAEHGSRWDIRDATATSRATSGWSILGTGRSCSPVGSRRVAG